MQLSKLPSFPTAHLMYGMRYSVPHAIEIPTPHFRSSPSTDDDFPSPFLIPLFPTCTLSVPEKSSYLPTPSLFDPTSIVNSAPSGFHRCSSLSQLASSEHHSDRLPEPTPLLFASANLASILNTAPSITIPLFSPTTWEIRPALLPSSCAWQPPTHPCPPADIFLV
ncbi:hypothetical protein CPAR01_08359 [Colletotrichum paranaense]|uniref:Uncharacterized protein n=1 Tax=Colletotrichum paranaense TaxID=1914294 RepID=A0ABQ9SK33_9PEZI|nr:uncharacterized protein CPAR01_08359 [Colletotrichum paranaense]KAK1538246.1 hypothetical protein CPAR01_08359 [Colletotrichum paranaense]